MAHSLLPDPRCLKLDLVSVVGDIILIKARTNNKTAPCPHGRKLLDLPWHGTVRSAPSVQGNPVRFELTLRKFFCDNQDCQRRIFAQPLPKIARRYQRKTARLESVLLQILWKVGASDAFFVAKLLGLIISDDAMLYQFKNAPEPNCSQTSPEEIGIAYGAQRT